MKTKIALIVLFISFWDCSFVFSNNNPDIEIENCDVSYSHLSSTNMLEVDFDDKAIFITPPPSNDLCTGATDFGILGCTFSEQLFEDPTANPDAEATGNCISDTDPGQWYTFTTPNPLPFSYIAFSSSVINVEIFKTSTDCSALEYVDCGVGIFYFSPDPGTKYYILTTGGLSIFTPYYIPNSCDDNININYTINNTFTSWSSTECGNPSNVVPCENDNVNWNSITIGCNESDLVISASEYSGSAEYPSPDELSISVFLDDCITLASEYDVNGLGYVCNAMSNGETITLEDIPPGTSLSIAFGSENSNMGSFDYSLLVTSDDVGITNDICDTAIPIVEGINEGLTNLCSTFTGGQSDPYIEGCPTQYEATVFYEFDPGDEAKNIIINVLSTGINSPAISVFTECLFSTYIDSECDESLEIICIDQPIIIEIGSSLDNAGNFDLEIITSPSGDAVETVITGDDICTNTALDILIDIPNGENVNIKIDVSPNSSPLVSGMTNPTYFGVTSATITDVLVNFSATVQEVIYTIDIDPIADICNDDPIEYSVLVYPLLSSTDIAIEECLPYILELDLSEVIKLGTTPYSQVSWYWNGTDLIGSGIKLTYEIVESGEIIVEVVDAGGCEATATINIEVLEPVTPTFDFPLEYCRSDQDVINFPFSSLENIGGSWNFPQFDLEFTPDGYYDILFTPDDLNCKLPVMLNIHIYSGIIPEFDLPDMICSDEGEYVFPTLDQNGVLGSWDITSIDASMITGIQTNTFTPNTSDCHAIYEYTYEVTSNLDMTFDQLDTICKFEQPIMLNDVSKEGFLGTWDDPIIDPSQITTDSIVRVWTPVIGQSPCINETQITIHFIEPTIPEFSLPTELCATDTIFTFPDNDNQSLPGSWTIPTIDPNISSGTIQSIFIPYDYCIEQSIWEIEILEPLVPSFSLVSTLCSLDTLYTLPLISDNGIEGIWSSPTIDPLTAGEKVTVVFNGESSGKCVEPIEVVFDIIEAEVPNFDLPEKMCWMESDLTLPTSSQNGIDGIWEPSFIDIQANIGATVTSTFTPLENLCAEISSSSVTILAPYEIDISVEGPSGCVIEDGSISIDAGSIENMEYSIDGGVTWQPSFEFNSLSSGGYTVFIRSADLSDCILEEEVYLNSVDGPLINDVTSNNISNCITQNGSILIDAIGNDLEYSINGGNTWQSSNEFNDLPSGSYMISIREALSDCIVEIDANIEDIVQTQLLLINALDVSDCNANDGQIEIIAVGELLEYSIDNGANWSTQSLFKNLPSGDYNIIVRSTVGEDCSKESTVVLSGPSMPQIVDILSQNPTVCTPDIGKIEVIANGDNLEYSFDGGISWQNTNVIANVLAGNYNLIARDSNRIQCFAEDFVSIEEDSESLEESTFMITPPTDCELSNGMFEVMNSTMGIEYSRDQGMTWQNNSVFSNLPSGSYNVITRIISMPNCLVEQSLEIPDVDCDCQKLVVDYMLDNMACEDEDSASIELTSIQGMNDTNIDIVWSDGTIGPIHPNIQEGWQAYTINYDDHCVWEDSIFIEIPSPITFDWVVQHAECPDRNNGIIEILNVSGGSNNYQFSLDNMKYQAGNIFKGLTDGNYDVFVRDDENCMSIQTIEISSPETIEIQLSDIEIVNKNESIILNPLIDEMSIDSFSWTPIEGITNPNELIIEVLPQIPLMYTLEIFYGDCYEKKTINISIAKEKTGIYFGNVFSPNGDNINDFFYVQGRLDPNINLKDISIYDRWGSKVFSNPNPQINKMSDGWDGSLNGEKVISDVYVYSLTYTVNGVEKVEIGMFSLIY